MFSIDNLITLALLTLLQAVLGFDNLLYISLESKRVDPKDQKKVRTIGIIIAMALRILLLFVLINVIQYFQDPVIVFNLGNIIEANMNTHSLIVLIGGGFIIYTAIKEILHMLTLDLTEGKSKESAPIGKVITMIVIMNLVFSFDSILSAMALTNVFWVMAAAIGIGGVLMIWLSDQVATFLEKNKMYEVLGLFVLFVVGIMLITEGGHLGHLSFFGNDITPMSKTTFYFIIGILVIVDLVQGKYQKNLLKKK
ncbi:MAG: TerC family protein [Cyclobacteriaceae bacterium]